MELYDSGSTADLDRLADSCVDLLRKHKLIVTTAESCTGGMLSAKLVDIPGVSEVFQEGYVTYSNKSKRRLLNVSKSTLKKYGAVSTQTAREMAIGAVFAASADIAVSITGIAGPVGLVFIACYMNDRVTVEEHHFRGSRSEVRTQSVQSALRLLRATILEHSKD